MAFNLWQEVVGNNHYIDGVYVYKFFITLNINFEFKQRRDVRSYHWSDSRQEEFQLSFDYECLAMKWEKGKERIWKRKSKGQMMKKQKHIRSI